MRPSRINYMNTHILPRFEYYEPKSLEEALELLDKLGPDAKVLAGGTDLLVKMKAGFVRPKYIVNIKKVPGLRYIRVEDGYLKIGALTTWNDLEESEVLKYFPALADAVDQMGSLQVRVMGTIGGNLCNASPAADSAPPLLVYDAEVVLASVKGVRVVRLEDFFTGPGKTVCSFNELLTEIRVPFREGSSAFIKIARTSMDLAIASVAVRARFEGSRIEDVAVALGSVAPKPIRARRVEEMLRGLDIGSDRILDALNVVVEEISPITDIRSTAWYRREVSKVLVYDALMKACERSRGGVG
ncbi:FAD binding domain-containing protein [Thermogladius sp. 4427co]|uniref:FAD binding domain-containing protein n=1 Tax=Thermogladius sp. 4427co TaxID=3450718 RepID=UPI003F7AACF6